MSAKIHGRNPGKFPLALAGWQRHHRPDGLTVEQNDDGWVITCKWWHTTPDLQCCPIGGGEFPESQRPRQLTK